VQAELGLDEEPVAEEPVAAEMVAERANETDPRPSKVGILAERLERRSEVVEVASNRRVGKQVAERGNRIHTDEVLSEVELPHSGNVARIGKDLSGGEADMEVPTGIADVQGAAVEAPLISCIIGLRAGVRRDDLTTRENRRCGRRHIIMAAAWANPQPRDGPVRLLALRRGKERPARVLGSEQGIHRLGENLGRREQTGAAPSRGLPAAPAYARAQCPAACRAC